MNSKRKTQLESYKTASETVYYYCYYYYYHHHQYYNHYHQYIQHFRRPNVVGIDKTPSFLLKGCSETVAAVLKYIFNRSVFERDVSIYMKGGDGSLCLAERQRRSCD